MIRIVVDTNVLVSAIGWKESKERQIIDKCADGDFQLIESKALFDEFEKVVSRLKFEFIPHRDKLEFISLLTKISEVVIPGVTLNLVEKDESDNRILECALAGKADYIISKDKHLLELKNLGEIKITTPTDFLLYKITK